MAKKYSTEQAVDIASVELDLDVADVKTEKGFVYYGFGVDDEGCCHNGWWLSRVKNNHSIEVIVCGNDEAMNVY